MSKKPKIHPKGIKHRLTNQLELILVKYVHMAVVLLIIGCLILFVICMLIYAVRNWTEFNQVEFLILTWIPMLYFAIIVVIDLLALHYLDKHNIAYWE